MHSSAITRRSSRLTENVHPNLKRKANTPLFEKKLTSRPALGNLTNANNILNGNSKVQIKKENVPKNVPNYLKPTYSTLQKCVLKNNKSDSPKSAQAKCDPATKKNEVASLKQKQVAPCKSKKAILKSTKNPSSKPTATQKSSFSKERQSLKNMRAAESNKSVVVDDNCFGFEREGIENSETHKSEDLGPVVSPCRIEITPSRKCIPSTPKPPVNKVLSVLKSSILSSTSQSPRTIETKLPQYFTTTVPQKANESSVIFYEPEISFDRPPRRSYTRQKPVKNFAEFDGASSDDDEKIEKSKVKEVEQKNKTETKEEPIQDKKFDELAAAMNSKFSEIEKFLLVVE